MKGLFWNCRGIRKKGLASYLREMMGVNNFDFICIQETMVQDFTAPMIRRVDPNNGFLWDWSPSNGRFGGILSGFKVDSFDVGSKTQGEFILMHVIWDKKLERMVYS
jgi:exonuclease III